MEEQQVNPTENQAQAEDKAASRANLLDGISAVAAAIGVGASLATQQTIFVALPLAASVGVHLYNRRQSLEAINQHYETMMRQQNLHIVRTEQKLTDLTAELAQFKQDSEANLEAVDQENNLKMDGLSEQIKQLQSYTTELVDQTEKNLQNSLLSLESQHQKLADVVGELCQIENYSQVLRANPKAADAYYQRGVSHQHLGDKQGAIEDYTEAIHLDHECAKAYHNRGIVYGEIGNRKSAVDDLRQAAKLYFEHGDIDSYQQARDLAKQYYDMRDLIPEEEAKSETFAEPVQPEMDDKGKVKLNVPSTLSVSANNIFA